MVGVVEKGNGRGEERGGAHVFLLWIGVLELGWVSWVVVVSLEGGRGGGGVWWVNARPNMLICRGKWRVLWLVGCEVIRKNFWLRD